MVYENIVSTYLGINIDIKLESELTMIVGDSSTGKSFLFDALQQFARITYNNLVCINYLNSDLLYLLPSYKNKCIVIDNAELLVTEDVAKIINAFNNQYILIGRNTKFLYIQPNTFKIVKFDNDKLQLEGVSYAI